MAKCSIWWIIQEIQIKSIGRYHLCQVRLIAFKKRKKKCYGEYGKRGNSYNTGRNWSCTAIMENNVDVHQKPLVYIQMNLCWRHLHSYIITSLITLGKTWNQHQQKNGKNGVYIHNGILSAKKKKKWMKFCCWK